MKFYKNNYIFNSKRHDKLSALRKSCRKVNEWNDNESLQQKGKCISVLKKITCKVMFKIRLWEMDRWWEYTGGSSWQLFPPSFYYIHTEEEIEQITKETVQRITKMIDDLYSFK